MDSKFNTLLSIVIIPQTISLIIEKNHLDEFKAVNEFYKSKVYSLLSKEETKMWHYSALTIYYMWKSEKETGEILFPEE